MNTTQENTRLKKELINSTKAFYKADFNSTLFPLKTNLILIDNHEKDISEYIYQKILNVSCHSDNFYSQQKVFATKPKGHLRRTVKLDPVAEYFIYDLIYRNRSCFRSKVSNSRLSFGYRFREGTIITVHEAYNELKTALADLSKIYSHSIQFDIASYFNSLYHHDIHHWFASKDGVSEKDSLGLGQFCREINSGRSIDFLPHGIYPCKMIGNEFLKFIDLSGVLKSSKIVRFMDDFAIFDNDENVIKQDFIRIQILLGQYGLNVNPSKTYYDSKVGNVQATLSGISDSLKDIISEVEEVVTGSTIELVEVESEVEKELSSEQISELLNLLKQDTLEETDADLILGFFRSHSNRLLEQLPMLLFRFPNLIKHIYSVCSTITDKKELVGVIKSYLDKNSFFLEYQLFWLATIVEDYLLAVPGYGEILMKIFELSADYKIARAKVLEIPENGFGFKEIRTEFLKTGQSDWLSWASAVGSRKLKSAERNYMLEYFSKGSQMNCLIASCIKKCKA